MNDIIEVRSALSAVSVCLNGATVTRFAKVKLAKGENKVVIKGLSPTADPDSAGVACDGARLVFSCYEVSPAEGANTKDKDPLNTRLEQVIDLISENNDRVSTIERTLKILSIKQMRSDKNDWCDEFSNKSAGLLAEKRAVLKKTAELKKEQQQLEHAIKTRNTTEALEGRISATIAADGDCEAKLTITYVERRAAWTPKYKLVAADTLSKCSVSLHANVVQNTYEDWNDIPLTLSTATPVSGSTLPKLPPIYLNAPMPNMGYKLMATSMRADMSMAEDSDEAVTGALNEVAPQYGDMSAEFPVAGNRTIKSSSEPTVIEVMERTVDTKYKYSCVPKLDKRVYLTAEIPLDNEVMLFNADADIYYAGQFVGSTFISRDISEEHLTASLGTVAGIEVSRSNNQSFTDKKTISGKRKTTTNYKITVLAVRELSSKLELKDQIPVSKTANIKVEALELSGANLSEETGILTWSVPVTPNKKTELEVRYSVLK